MLVCFALVVRGLLQTFLNLFLCLRYSSHGIGGWAAFVAAQVRLVVAFMIYLARHPTKTCHVCVFVKHVYIYIYATALMHALAVLGYIVRLVCSGCLSFSAGALRLEAVLVCVMVRLPFARSNCSRRHIHVEKR